jgi:SAM-dependent methyltransferase
MGSIFRRGCWRRRALGASTARSLAEADIGALCSASDPSVGGTGLDTGAYDLVVSCLVDEHLADLGPLYSEAARLGRPGARFVLVGFHPHFIIASGMPTHFDDAESGESVAIETHVHLLSEHVAAGRAAGFALAELHERVVDDEWVALKPKWERFRDHPISFAFVWVRGS